MKRSRVFKRYRKGRPDKQSVSVDRINGLIIAVRNWVLKLKDKLPGLNPEQISVIRERGEWRINKNATRSSYCFISLGSVNKSHLQLAEARGRDAGRCAMRDATQGSW